MGLWRNNSVRMLGLLWLTAVAGRAEPSAEQLRSATLEHVRNGTEAEGVARFTEYLAGRAGTVARTEVRELDRLSAAADCIRFMELAEGGMPEPLAEWVLGSPERLHLLVDSLDPGDNKPQVVRILDELREHDPKGTGQYFNLALAIALVMDSPSKPIHGQMGRKGAGRASLPVERYDYFKTLYSTGSAKLDYADLGVSELLFVVHVPVPISELRWALENEKGSLSDWAEKYNGIVYDRQRLRGSQYQWPHGAYVLSAIRGRGGICVDQAYYAVMTARAHGIPAIYFSGSGKSSGHAWFGYMRAPGKWALDIGRYKDGKYTTGHAVNPQTGEYTTDHEVGFICNSLRRSRGFARANELSGIAETLQDGHPTAALHCAKNAREQARYYLRPWETEFRILCRERNCDELLRFFREQKKAFGEYPDILALTAKGIEPILREEGRSADADALLRNLAGAVDDDRDDLARMFGFGQIEQIIESGDMKKARKKMEALLNSQKEGGNKVFWLVEKYTKLVLDSGQEHEAAKFLPGYVEKLRYENSFPASYERRLLLCLRAVYERDGNARKAKEVEQQLESLGYRAGKMTAPSGRSRNRRKR